MDVIDGKWIKARLSGQRGEQARLAEAMGIDNDKISKILKGLRKVQPEEIPAVIAFFEDRTAPTRVDIGDEVPAEAALVPIYDVAAAAGDGMVVEEYEAVLSHLAFPPNYIKHITRTNPKNLAIISVIGNSMVPTLAHDDIVMVDATKKNIDYDGMFVLRHGGLLKVKRVQWGPGRETVILISDNDRQHQPMEVPASDIEVVGRVVWTGVKQP